MIADLSADRAEPRLRCPPMRRLGGGFLAALVVAAVAAAATTPPLPLHVLKRSAHGYDKLPAVAKGVGAVSVSRRVATAIDKKHNGYLVYVTVMKDKSVCAVLLQGRSYSARCTPQFAMFTSTSRTFSVVKGLIGGVAADGIKKVVL